MTMYKLIQGLTRNVNTIQRLLDNAFIPCDPDNSDYQAFLKHQAEGGKVYAADEEILEGEAQ